MAFREGPRLRFSSIPKALLLTVGLALAGWLSPATADLADTIVKIKPAILGVGSLHPTRTPRARIFGTAFVVADGRHAVTNAHVIEQSLETARNERLVVFVGQGPNPQARAATKVAVDAEHDLALLRFEGEPLPPMTLGDSRAVREGQSLAFTGYPIGAVLGLYPATHRAMVAAVTPVVAPKDHARQLSAATIARLRDPYMVFQLDATAYPGSSGSPVYEPDSGRVVAVINMVFVKGTKEDALSHPSGITYAIPARYVQELIDSALGEGP